MRLYFALVLGAKYFGQDIFEHTVLSLKSTRSDDETNPRGNPQVSRFSSVGSATEEQTKVLAFDEMKVGLGGGGPMRR